MSSFASPSAPVTGADGKPLPYPYTTSGNLVSSGMKDLVDIANKYSDNEAIGALVVGGLVDAAKTKINTGLENQYNDSFMAGQATYNAILDNNRTGNTKSLMGTEAGLTKEVIEKNADESIRLGKAGYGSTGYMTQAEVAKQNAVNTGMLDVSRENRLGSDFAEVTRGQTSKDVASTQANAARDVAGIQGDWNVRNTTETGRQQRMLEGEKTDQQMRLRADARGAIRSAGGRFYG